MGMYKKILVAVDITPENNQVLQQAVELAKLHGAELLLIHVAATPVTVYSQWGNFTPHISENEVRESVFASIAAKAEAVGIDRGKVHIDFGSPVERIISLASKEKADLILIGSHGRHGVRLLLGSTANGVLHNAPCDVLAMRVRDD